MGNVTKDNLPFSYDQVALGLLTPKAKNFNSYVKRGSRQVCQLLSGKTDKNPNIFIESVTHKIFDNLTYNLIFKYATVKARICFHHLQSSVHMEVKVFNKMEIARQDKYARGRLKKIHFYSHFHFIKNIDYAPAPLGRVRNSDKISHIDFRIIL